MSAAPSNETQKRKLLWSEDLCDFLAAIDSYEPTLPSAVSAYYLEKSGMSIKDDKIPQFVSLAVDKLVSEVVHEAKQISTLRQQSVKNQKKRAEMADTLELVDLEASLAQAKVFLRRKKPRTED
jgi:transcription initiation factor TFIID subunit 10